MASREASPHHCGMPRTPRLNFKRVNFVLLAAVVLAMAGAQAFNRHFGLACVGVAMSVVLFVAHIFRARHFRKSDKKTDG